MSKFALAHLKPSKSFEASLFFLLLTGFFVFISFTCVLSLRSTTPKKSLPFPSANYSSLIKVNNELIAFTFDIHAPELQFATMASSVFDNIDLPDDPNCTYSTHYTVAGSFPDGRIQIMKLCFTEPKTKSFLMAYNWESRELTEIAGPIPLGSGPSYWNPDQSKGLVFLQDGSRTRETLYSISEEGIEALDLLLTDDGKSWNLMNFYPDFPDSKTLESGNAGPADWSSDGQLIAFFASTEAIGIPHAQRGGPYKLYITDSDEWNPQPVLEDIYSPFVLEWSPNSKYIAFIVGTYKQKGHDGLWLFSLEDRSIVNIGMRNYQDILWGSDDKHLYAIKCNGLLDCPDILEYDLQYIINKQE